MDDSSWGFTPAVTVCNRCEWRILVPERVLPPADSHRIQCPHCFAGELSPLNESAEELDQNLPNISPPELLLPYRLPADELADQVRSFSRGIPFAPADLNPQNLAKRLKRIYLPQWLVDSGVRANWQFEAGFDYEVVSHQERYSDSGGWNTQELNETRVRWEPRQGNLERSYQNMTAPALETHARLRGQVGDFDLSAAQAYQSQDAGESFVRLPDRGQEDAWSEVVPIIRAAAALECQKAASADHHRDFRWEPEYHSQNWTLLLRPIYTTYYLDDQNQPQVVMINGQSGQTSGMRRSSMKRAQRTTLVILAVAVLIFVTSLVLTLGGIALPLLLPLGGVGVLIAVLVALGAIIPIALAWQFNRSQKAASQ